MEPGPPLNLSRREREIMGILHRKGEASAAAVAAELDGAPANATVRTLLRILVDKGHARYDRDGVRYVYRPAARAEEVGASMMRYVVRTFFGGSAPKAMAALLGSESEKLTEAEIARLEAMLAEKGEQ